MDRYQGEMKGRGICKLTERTFHHTLLGNKWILISSFAFLYLQKTFRVNILQQKTKMLVGNACCFMRVCLYFKEVV